MRRRKTKTKVGIKKEGPVMPIVEKKTPPGKPPKRIRMLRSCANQYMAYIKGHSYEVPQEVPVETARSWIGSGTAEEEETE